MTSSADPAEAAEASAVNYSVEDHRGPSCSGCHPRIFGLSFGGCQIILGVVNEKHCQTQNETIICKACHAHGADFLMALEI